MGSEKKVTKGFFLKSPGKTARSFAVIGFEEGSGGKRKNFTIYDDRVVAINKLYKSGTLDFERARAQAREVVQDLYRKNGTERQALRRAGLFKDNCSILEKFWEVVYGGRELVDEESAKYDYIRAVKALGDVSLLSGTQTQMAEALKKSCSRPRRRRRMVNRINTILKYLGRDFRLQKPQDEINEIRHLTIQEVNLLLQAEEDPNYRDLFATLFATGVRIGEAMALTEATIQNDVVFVGSQIDNKGRRRLPKRGKTGHALYLPQYEENLRRWARVENKTSYRQNINRRLDTLTNKLWPSEPSKQISVHGFRHSHAIHFLSKGVSLEFVARNLRNRIEVCQKYYLGYSHTSSTITALRNLLLKE